VPASSTICSRPEVKCRDWPFHPKEMNAAMPDRFDPKFRLGERKR
jgi:hypothetical protein